MEKDFSNVTNGISRLVEQWENVLIGLDVETLSKKRNKQNRTIKQILGHLIDSASNNHQRIVRLQYNKHLIFPDYAQDNDLWIAIQDYQHADWPGLIQLWKFYNLRMIHIIRSVDQTQLTNFWYSFKVEKVTLSDMIEGYLSHLNLHLNEIDELMRS